MCATRSRRPSLDWSDGDWRIGGSSASRTSRSSALTRTERRGTTPDPGRDDDGGRAGLFRDHVSLMAGWIVITLGDITGIGPEVTLKALAAELPADDTRYLLIGDAGCVEQLNLKLALNLPVQPYRKPIGPGRVFVFNPFPQPLLADLAPGYPAAARAALASLTDAAQRSLRHEMDALVTAPVNKEAILRTGHPFVGQTEFLSKLAAPERTTIMLLAEDHRARWP